MLTASPASNSGMAMSDRWPSRYGAAGSSVGTARSSMIRGRPAWTRSLNNPRSRTGSRSTSAHGFTSCVHRLNRVTRTCGAGKSRRLSEIWRAVGKMSAIRRL